MIHAYAVTAMNATGDYPTGVDGEPVGVMAAGPIGVVVSRHPELSVDVTLERLTEHERVVEAAFAKEPVLPVRYGADYGDEIRLLDDVLPRADRLRDRIGQLAGCVELALRIEPPAGSQPNEAVAIVDEAVRLVSPIATAADCSERGEGRVAFLVAQLDMNILSEVLRVQADSHPSVAFILTGPWPPYSFVTEPPAQRS